jgi:hypothetical protein
MLCFACAVIVWHIPCKDTRPLEGCGQAEGASRQVPRPGIIPDNQSMRFESSERACARPVFRRYSQPEDTHGMWIGIDSATY